MGKAGFCRHRWKMISSNPPTMTCHKCEVLVVDPPPREMGGIVEPPDDRAGSLAESKTTESEYLPIRLILLSGSANAVSSISSLQPMSNGKLACVILAYLRDIGGRELISFVGAITNLADTGTKTRVTRCRSANYASAGFLDIYFTVGK